MRPIRLTMEAFGSYGEKTVIDFTKLNQNLFLISGETGSGKSTVFDAISFALYGRASSIYNRKDGPELQSDYAGRDVTPYVELVFSKNEGGSEQLYNVRREPQHVRQISRKTKTGNTTRSISERVCLIMPDGTEYPQKEANEKLVELIGLTRDQFAQIVMIAQGEFMELLRADSKKKKEIFRRLFGTEIYEDIVRELDRRCKEASADVDRIQTGFKTEIARVVIPADCGQREKLSELKAEISGAANLGITAQEDFVNLLGAVCGELENRRTEAENLRRQAGEVRDETNNAYNTAKALSGSFGQLEKALEDLKECEQAWPEMKAAQKTAADIDNAYDIQTVYRRYADSLERVASTEKELKRQNEQLPKLADSLLKAEEHLNEWADIGRKAENINAAISGASREEKDMTAQERTAKDALSAFESARMRFRDRKNEYESKYDLFIREQAGILARRLEDGSPCPVCGSTEHPHPCELSEEHRELTRETIDSLSAEVEELRGDLDARSKNSGSAEALLEEKRQVFSETMRELREQMAECISGIPDELTLREAETIFADWVKALKLKMARALGGAVSETECGKLTVNGLLTEAKKALDAARRNKERAETLIGQYTESLPGLRSELKERKAEYDAILNVKSMTESEWQAVAAQHKKGEAETLRESVSAYEKKRLAAETRRDAARDTIGDKTMPDMDKLEEAKSDADSAWETADAAWLDISRAYDTDNGIYISLKESMAERERVMQKYGRLQGLYEKLSGKRTGERMDIETFVQRYHLARILDAANQRFRDMTEGQLELRMTPEDQAGVGKNRGLDLMVYSSVTGREREINTLSGGESFMAALALSLGIADQVQAESAVSLDMMFIDEGFGSLSANARAQAVGVLQRMSAGSKMIGIISHVSELRQMIEDQLMVTKDEKGSHVRWDIS